VRDGGGRGKSEKERVRAGVKGGRGKGGGSEVRANYTGEWGGMCGKGGGRGCGKGRKQPRAWDSRPIGRCGAKPWPCSQKARVTCLSTCARPVCVRRRHVCVGAMRRRQTPLVTQCVTRG
jgi:hypothetical protein